MIVRLLRPSLMVSAVLTLSGCGSSADTEGGEGKDEVVALVATRAITAGEFQAKLEEQPPFVRARYATLEKKKELLDNMVRFELLLQEARRQGLDKDPEIQATLLDKLMVQKLLRQRGEAATGSVSERNLDTFLNDLKAGAKVEVREAALEKISVESSTAAADPPAAP